MKKDVKKISVRFIFTFGILWGFLESMIVFGVMNLEKGGGKYFITLLLFSLFLSIINWYYDKLTQDRELSTLLNNIKIRTSSISRHSKRFHSDGSYYKLLFLDWRIETELKKIRKLHGGHFQIEGRKPFDNLIYVFRSVITKLQEGDVYRTLSCIDFWEHVRLERNFFLTENLEAAKRGVTIKRILIIDKELFKSKIRSDDRRILEDVVRGIYEKAINSKGYFDKMELKFFYSDNYTKDISYPVPYALITNDNFDDYMALLPTFNQFRDSPFLDIYFTHDKTNTHFITHDRRFEDLWGRNKGLYTLEETYDKLFGVESTTANKT
ncbi:hypothetical protein [Aquimarina sp. AU58]|uniref:hypothetical protein n=1 Tax=Aquimarina sp. AU58 TaxID=1874112 RepID=UPI001359CBE5|nr:hypothetical protein [Aquimarina sp. AU58]